MIDIAKQKMPQATLVNWDFSKELPDEIKNGHFDYIISTYAIHHLEDKDKINFIKMLSFLLNRTGKILLGDISFETRDQLEKCSSRSTRATIPDCERFGT
jgi:putative AdoMet-dependent methyltransferase